MVIFAGCLPGFAGGNTVGAGRHYVILELVKVVVGCVLWFVNIVAPG